MNARRAGLSGVLVMAVGFACGAATAVAEQKTAAAAPNLSGHWRLNKELSDDESARLATAAPEGQKAADSTTTSQAEPEGRGGREGGRRGRSAGSQASKSAPPGNDPRGAVRPAEPSGDMTVTQTEVAITVEDAPGQTRSYYPNGKTYKADDGASDVKSAWKDGALVFEKKNVRGWKMSESWQLSADGARLSLAVRYEGGGRPSIVVKRVYDRVAPTP